jgi:Xaa-Pro dipeptidase
MERPVVVVFSAMNNPPVIVLPELEKAKIANLPYPIQAFTYSDDPTIWASVFQNAVQSASMDGRRIGVEPTRLRVLELSFLEAAAPQAQFVFADEVLADLRICKDPSEIHALQMAVEIAQDALQATLPQVKVGVTERELASELTLQLLRAGSEPEISFSPIVASGLNSANPHGVPTDRPLSPGDMLIFDWGATYNGYTSDLTRTFAISEIDPEFERIAAIVDDANTAGRAAARRGVTAGSVDQAARAVIEQAGYGQYFFHRTGHGIGMEGHEAPYIRAGSDFILQAGMTFTIEPGIYLPDRGGVRIEDNVVITAEGARTLSDYPRDVRVIG